MDIIWNLCCLVENNICVVFFVFGFVGKFLCKDCGVVDILWDDSLDVMFVLFLSVGVGVLGFFCVFKGVDVGFYVVKVILVVD